MPNNHRNSRNNIVKRRVKERQKRESDTYLIINDFDYYISDTPHIVFTN